MKIFTFKDLVNLPDNYPIEKTIYPNKDYRIYQINSITKITPHNFGTTNLLKYLKWLKCRYTNNEISALFDIFDERNITKYNKEARENFKYEK